MERVKPTRYFGKACPKHQELGGDRSVVGNACVGCRLEADRKRRKNPLRLEQNRKWQRALRCHPDSAARLRESNRQRWQTPERKAWKRAWIKRPEQVARRLARYANDSNYALIVGARSRIYSALAGKEKLARTLVLLGVDSIQAYRVHLEKQFEPGMTWDNYGKAWHVDHRIPLSILDLSNPTGQAFGFNYKNTRPMWARQNLARGNRMVFEDLL